jgi:putative glutamine amidotransferase
VVPAPLVALTTYHLGPGQVRDWDSAHVLPASYADALHRAGARTALLPPGQPSAAEELLAPFDGLLLAGGGDVEAARYGAAAHPAEGGLDPGRDQLELELARAAVRLGVPVLGICRGMQVLNVALGGTLVQHLPDLPGLLEHRNKAEPAMHGLRVEPGSRLAAALGRVDGQVRSDHHQAVDRLGEGLRAVAWSPDGLVEGIERDQGWTVGVLWHPEKTAPTDPAQQRLLGAFVAQAATRGKLIAPLLRTSS